MLRRISTKAFAVRDSGSKRGVSRWARTRVFGASGRETSSGQVRPRSTNSSTTATPAPARTMAQATGVKRTTVLILSGADFRVSARPTTSP